MCRQIKVRAVKNRTFWRQIVCCSTVACANLFTSEWFFESSRSDILHFTPCHHQWNGRRINGVCGFSWYRWITTTPNWTLYTGNCSNSTKNRSGSNFEFDKYANPSSWSVGFGNLNPRLFFTRCGISTLVTLLDLQIGTPAPNTWLVDSILTRSLRENI